MNRVFPDTGYWIALFNPRDYLHDKAIILAQTVESHPIRDLGLNKLPVKVGWAKTTNKVKSTVTEKHFAHQNRDKLVYYFFAHPLLPVKWYSQNFSIIILSLDRFFGERLF